MTKACKDEPHQIDDICQHSNDSVALITNNESINLIQNQQKLSVDISRENLVKLSNNPLFIEDSLDKMISLDKFLLDVSNENSMAKITSTQKYIIILGITVGIQFLHTNNLYHGELCSQNIFLDDNFYPHIKMQNHDNKIFSFAEQNKNEIIDITSICFIAYELLTEKAVFNSNQKIDEKLEIFNLDNIENEWQKSFLQKFWPQIQKDLNINNIIDEIINNKNEFGEIEDDKLSSYIKIIEKFQNLYLLQLKRNADDNDVNAMLICGRMLKDGCFIDTNKKKAAEYFKKASSQGCVDAMYEYGMMLNNGNGIQKNSKKALHYFKESSDKEHLGAMFEYGSLIVSDSSLEKKKQGLDLINKTADHGYLKALVNLGIIINNKSLSDILNYLKVPADFGYYDAMNDLAVYLYKNDASEDEKYILMSQKYLKMAVSLGNPMSIYNYGIYLIDGKKFQKDINEGVRLVKKAADLGYMKAVKYYANMLLKGENIDENDKEAARYYKFAADKGDSDSMNIYGLMLRDGVGVDEDRNEAGRYFQMAFLDINNKNAVSMFNYGKMILEENEEEGLYYIQQSLENGFLPAFLFLIGFESKKVIINKEELLEKCKNLADQGNVDAMFDYAIMLYNGEGIEENKEEAAKYYQMAAEKGHIGSMNNLALMLLNGDGITKNKIEAAKYFQMAADMGHDISTIFIGVLLYFDDEVPNDKEKGLFYIKKAKNEGYSYPDKLYKQLIQNGEITEEEKKHKTALKLRKEIYNGNIEAMFNFAVMLLNGDGIYKSRKDAAEYFKMAAEKGHLASMNIYGKMLLHGDGIPINKIKAAQLLKAAADKGHCMAMHYYAYMLANGDGIKTDKEEAAKYYKKAADQGFTMSKNNYGIMLFNGDGIEMDKERAIKYLKAAADCGDDVYRLNFGVCNSVMSDESNDNKSIEYIKMSADEGNNDARFIYGNMLYNGKKVPIDKKEAANYFKLAADDGSIKSTLQYAEMSEKGDGIPINIQEAIKYYKKAILKNDKSASNKLLNLLINFSGCP